jgi:PAS domain S-box-containing protein
MSKPESRTQEALATPDRLAAVARARARASRSLAERLARLAAEGVAAPIGLVSLVEADRQIVLGAFGSLTGDGPHEVTLERSLCDAVVLAGIPLIVGDAEHDRRFGDSIAVRKHGLGAYVGFPIRDADDHVVGVLAVADFTAREWSARALSVMDGAAQLFTAGLAGELDRERRQAPREIDGFADALLDSLPGPIAACDGEGRLVHFNRAMRDLVGDDADGSPTEQWSARRRLHHPDGRPMSSAEIPLLRALRGEPVRDVDAVLRVSGKRDVTLMINGHPIVDSAGDRVGGVIIASDVTAQRRAERLQSGELAVAQVIADGTTVEATVPGVLGEIASCLNWPHGELWLVDELSDQLTPAARWDQPGRIPQITMATSLTRGDGLPGIVWETGTPMWVPDIAVGPLGSRTARESGLHAALAVPVRGSDGMLGVVAFFGRDVEEPQTPLISVLLGMAAQIGQFVQRRRIAEKVERLARSEEEYVALVGHELRTPLTSISAYTELLHETPDESTVGEVRPLLGVIERNTGLLLVTVENMLELSGLDSGQAPLDCKPTDLAALVRVELTGFAAIAAAQGVALRTHLPERLILVGDAERLAQVIDNLVSNAIRYTPDGGQVEIRLDHSRSAAVLTVDDTGVGIPPDEQDQVMRPFYRGAGGRAMGHRGTGLGLALTAAAVERHQGTLTIGPREPNGTSAVVRLPLHGPA